MRAKRKRGSNPLQLNLLGEIIMVNAKLFKTEKKFLSAKENFKMDGEILIIDSVFKETIISPDGESKESLCIRFKDVKQVLSLNQTNLMLCMAEFGDDTDLWISEKVRFVIVNQTYGGEIKKGIQISPMPKK
jgi:hypothetical protein